jgi:hypothetical protein
MRDEKETTVASSAIVEALKEFIRTLQSTYTGRFPTQVETVYDALSLAVSSSSPQTVSLKQVSSELRIGVEHLCRSRARWLRFGQSGDPSDLLKVRVKRIDAHPTEWREWVRNVGWLHHVVFRPT